MLRTINQEVIAHVSFYLVHSFSPIEPNSISFVSVSNTSKEESWIR